MSLMKSPGLTPSRIAVNQANDRQSEGPATPEGLERLRDAETRHGSCSKAEGEARIVDCRLGLSERRIDDWKRRNSKIESPKLKVESKSKNGVKTNDLWPSRLSTFDSRLSPFSIVNRKSSISNLGNPRQNPFPDPRRTYSI
jgi:hypothetical protein